jgi:Tfp pilus assembly protein PilP
MAYAATGEEALEAPGQSRLKASLDTAAGGEKQDAEYFYDATGKTDPFKSFIAEEDEVSKNKKRKPKTYLETLDLSQLELIAIMLSPKGNWAMVKESKGTGHTIKVGTAIGTSGGIVHEIADKKVVIREEYKDYKGNTVYRDITKKLPSLR